MRRDSDNLRGRRPWTLAMRITALVVSVASLVGVVAAVLTLQLLRDTIQDQTRTELRDQLKIASSGGTADAVQSAIAWAEHTGAMWAIVAEDGTVQGTAGSVLTPELVDHLLAEGTVSDLQIRPSEPVLLEGEWVGDGGLVLARTDWVLADASRELVFRVLPVLFLGIVTAVAGGALLARRITRPLVDTAAAADLMAHGARGVAVPDTDIPEVHTVAQALTALDRALETSESRQREFLLSISHEIRTPLTAVQGYGEALADQVMTAEQAGNVIQSEARRMSRFVDDLLELARLEADDFTVNLGVVDLVCVATSAHLAWQGYARRLEVTLRLDLPEEGSLVVETDPQRARQIIDGLLENALRVAPAGSAVQIEVGGPASVSVSDSGPGLVRDDLPHAFERGVLRARYADARPVGTGLGLSIAARLAPRIGATLTASAQEGGGALFTVSWGTIDPHR